VLVLATLGAPERRRLSARRRGASPPEAPPTPVSTARATVIDVGEPLAPGEPAQAWLRRAGEAELTEAVAILNRALRAHRLAAGDAYARPVSRAQAIAARVGVGAGEQVADGHWSAARELIASPPRRRRVRALAPEARLAAILGGRARPLVCEELALRARLDLDQGHDREAALQLLIALDAAVAELAGDPRAPALAGRLQELRDRRARVATVAHAAMARRLSAPELETVASALARIEAALRARAAAGA